MWSLLHAHFARAHVWHPSAGREPLRGNKHQMNLGRASICSVRAGRSTVREWIYPFGSSGQIYPIQIEFRRFSLCVQTSSLPH